MKLKEQIEATQRILVILKQRSSILAQRVSEVSNIRDLPRNIRVAIVEEELADELMSKGLNDNDEHNKYGIEIEDLIDACGLAWDDEEQAE